MPDPGTGASGTGEGVFLVPPNPAMHDEHAADEERQALRSRAAARDEDIRVLAARLGADRALAAAAGPAPAAAAGTAPAGPAPSDPAPKA